MSPANSASHEGVGGATEPHKANSLKRFNDEQDPFAQPILVTFHRQ